MYPLATNCILLKYLSIVFCSVFQIEETFEGGCEFEGDETGGETIIYT